MDLTKGLEKEAEARLLLECARGRVEAPAGTDWEYVVRKAERHGLAPLVYQNLGGAPEAVVERLRGRFRENALHALWMSAELVALTRRLEGEGIDVMAFKGPVLAQSAYGDVALREYGDLDLLVRTRDAARARAVLEQRGYHSAVAIPDPERACVTRGNGQFLYTRRRATVELHWRLLPEFMPQMAEFDELWARSEVVEIHGQGVRTFGAEDLVLFLAVHGCKHLWTSMGWACDLARVIEGAPGLRWEVVAARAAAGRYGRMLRLGLTLASGLFGAAAPGEPAGEAGEVAARAFAEGEAPEMSVWALNQGLGRLLETRGDRLRMWVGALTPQIADFQALPVPRRWFWIYYGVRPARMVGKHLLRVR